MSDTSITILWMVVDVKSDDGRWWEALGLFDSEEKADAACTHPHHCMFPLTLNHRYPDESVEMENARYPRAEEA